MQRRAAAAPPGGKPIKCEAILQCLVQNISNAKQYYNVWRKTYQMRSNNTLFGAKHIKCEAIIQCLVQNISNEHQYFGCLPLKISSICFHSILKRISATRRIFFVFYLIFVISISVVYPSKIAPFVSIQY